VRSLTRVGRFPGVRIYRQSADIMVDQLTVRPELAAFCRLPRISASATIVADRLPRRFAEPAMRVTSAARRMSRCVRKLTTGVICSCQTPMVFPLTKPHGILGLIDQRSRDVDHSFVRSLPARSLSGR
jgi:hypothetical protein